MVLPPNPDGWFETQPGGRATAAGRGGARRIEWSRG
jgi:hypothetical protein